MAFPLPFQQIVNLILIAIVLAPLSAAVDCSNDVSSIGSDMSNTLCGNGGGGNVGGSGTIIVPDPSSNKKLKRQSLSSQNFSLLIQKYPYQISPYFKPAAVLRACTGSIVTSFDTADANLNGRGQTFVSQRQSCNSSGPIQLFSGLGRSVRIIKEDIFIDNWVIHISDDYFTIPTLLSSTLRTIGGTGAFANATNSSLSAFDFVPSITAFVSTDSAFAAALRCGQGSTATINQLALLSSSIVQGFVAYSPLLVDGAFFRSANGEDITVQVNNTIKYVNGARVVQEDIVIRNGVVHIVDGLVSNNGLSCPPVQATTTPVSLLTTTITTTITIVTPASPVTTTLTITTRTTATATITAPPTAVLTVTPPTRTVFTTITAPPTAVLTVTPPTRTVFTTTTLIPSPITLTTLVFSTILTTQPCPSTPPVTRSTTIIISTSPTSPNRPSSPSTPTSIFSTPTTRTSSPRMSTPSTPSTPPTPPTHPSSPSSRTPSTSPSSHSPSTSPSSRSPSIPTTSFSTPTTRTSSPHISTPSTSPTPLTAPSYPTHPSPPTSHSSPITTYTHPNTPSIPQSSKPPQSEYQPPTTKSVPVPPPASHPESGTGGQGYGWASEAPKGPSSQHGGPDWGTGQQQQQPTPPAASAGHGVSSQEPKGGDQSTKQWTA